MSGVSAIAPDSLYLKLGKICLQWLSSSIWRPLVPVVESYPLAICPFPYTSKGDLVPVDIVFPRYSEEALEILPNPAQCWIFRSGATFEDVTLLKVIDSDSKSACCEPAASLLLIADVDL